jgi:transposase
MLGPRLQTEILRLHFSEHLSRNAIARQLGVNRKTVAAVIERRQVRLAVEERAARPSILEPHHARIRKLLDDAPERSCVNILQRLREAGYTGGISILRDYVRGLRPEPHKEAFFDLEFAKGEAAQVDWGEFGDVFGIGTKVHAFVMVLCWSRLLYLEFTLRETLPTLLRCYERALRFFAGRCREYWHDNMPTVVAERLGRLRRFTTGFLAYVGFHGLKPVLCAVGAGHEKGRVEDGVRLVRHQFWPGRRFVDIDDINRQARGWRDQFANRREHHVTGKVPALLFEQERPALQPLRPEPYDTDDLVSCEVSRFFRVRFEGNEYSVPWTMVGKTVTVRGDDKLVRVYYGHKKIATHERCYLKGRKIQSPTHADGLKDIKPGAARHWKLEAIRSFGPHACHYLELIGAGTRSLRHEADELLFLATVYGNTRLEQTIGELLERGCVGAGHLEQLLRASDAVREAPPPLQLPDQRLHFVPPGPCLADYDALLLDARREQQDDQEEE